MARLARCRASPGLLLHEVVFGVSWSRPARSWRGKVSSVPGTLGDGGILLLNGALIAACWRKDSARWWRLRLLFYAVAVNLVYFFMRGECPGWAVPS